jgi:hypothetical protein
MCNYFDETKRCFTPSRAPEDTSASESAPLRRRLRKRSVDNFQSRGESRARATGEGASEKRINQNTSIRLHMRRIARCIMEKTSGLGLVGW